MGTCPTACAGRTQPPDRGILHERLFQQFSTDSKVGVSATHAATRASNVSAANEHEQAGFRGQVADASRNARFGERPTIASLPTVTALRSRGTRYPPLCVALARSTTVSCGVQFRYYVRVFQSAAGCRPSTCPALLRGRPPRPSAPSWPQSRRQVRLCTGLQAAASALVAWWVTASECRYHAGPGRWLPPPAESARSRRRTPD